MRIAIISEYNSFSTIGGTEYYVEMLLEGLGLAGIDLLFITKGTANKVEKLTVSVKKSSYKVSFIAKQNFSIEEVKQKVISKSYPLIMYELESFKPDIIHVHTLTTFFNILHLELCSKAFKNIIFTAHVPIHFCAKGDLIQNNNKPCNGEIKKIKCSSCLFTKSVKVGFTNMIYSHYLYPLHLLSTLNEKSVHIITPSLWQKQQIVRNGFSAKNISVIRQALSTKDYLIVPGNNSSSFFTIGFLGRLSPEKGSSLLLGFIEDIVRCNANIKFVLGIPENSDAVELQKLQKIILKYKENIILMKDINSSNKNSFFEKINCLFIPSFFLETGPIVLMEALFYNKKVLAPNVSGTMEFAKEFPQDVICYKWNDKNSAVLELVKLKKANFQSMFDYPALFEKKEMFFIESHLNIYKSILDKNLLLDG